MEDHEDSFDDLTDDLDFLSDLDHEEEIDFKELRYHFQHLNQNDYSLNSPLVQDDLIGYIQKRQNKSYPKPFEQSDWKRRDLFFTFLKVNFDYVKHPSQLHSWWASVSLSNTYPTDRIKMFLDTVKSESDVTFPVVEAFYKGWVNRVVKNPMTEGRKIPYSCYKWGELFLMAHDIILLMNANSVQERRELKKTITYRNIKDGDNILGFKMSTHLGPCYIVGKVCYFMDHKVLIDRLFLLMMKDTWIGRFNTLLGMLYRTECSYRDVDIEYLSDLYRLGDNVLLRCGNEAYNTIKLLEPICNHLFCEFAHIYRPLMPAFPNFERHVMESIEDVSTRSWESRLFCQRILEIPHLDLLTVVYGSFRHWGHPFLDYLVGLKALHEQVTVKKEIDEEYAGKLGSDLAYIVLRKKFVEDKKWYVDYQKMDPHHPLRQFIKDNVWPTPKVIEDFGDRWHTLPLLQCFDIPDVIDPSLLYSDKSHSRDRSEVISFLQSHPGEVIPTEKVLNTLLKTKGTNWPEFLHQVNETGLPEDSLIIGLKGKEREVKVKGRFFSLMSWKLREYFVVTEYLIKEHFVPLFNGLTMADDMTTVISKLMDRTQGQGGEDYTQVCIANHIDYEKWNNHQRKRATGPVFIVMGQFLGFPKLIYRTHEFFESSWVYYNARPDLMVIRDGRLENLGPEIVCWNGQDGGLEGLRQKGWTVVGLLMIRREARVRNTAVKILAQGDNQVICSQYKLKPYVNELDLRTNLRAIWENNNSIMAAIVKGTNKLGLIINEDETMQSADYLNYGKIPVFRGRILNLFTKRLSRIMCVTNDQILSYGNIMSTVSTNCLTIAHFDSCPDDGIFYYNFFGTMTRLMIERHNPVLGSSVGKYLKDLNSCTAYKIKSLFLDPSLGGACGTSLARFLCRAFPDPVTEGLSFWKVVHLNTYSSTVRKVAVDCGYPKIKEANHSLDFAKLLEKPNSLNIPKNMSLTNLLKTEIKKSLVNGVSDILNETIRDAVIYLSAHEKLLMDFLWSVDPLFPKFLSEFRSSTFIGVTDSLVGLFQNARTIRTTFSKKLTRDINQLTWECELGTYRYLSRGIKLHVAIWSCSSHHADRLRQSSWGRKVVGTTVPHPLEMFGKLNIFHGHCYLCDGSTPDYLTCLAPQGLNNWKLRKGPYTAYLGSRTAESTSILQPWEREHNVSLIKRAVKLRNAIHWFVDLDSNLGRSILSVLEGLTGLRWDQECSGFKRTGSALHRFSCSRMSSGGYAACNPSKLSWIIISTDTFEVIGGENYDFMFQPSILYGQMSMINCWNNQMDSAVGHLHLTCRLCLRKIQEPTLESMMPYKHPDVSRILDRWKPAHTLWFKIKPKFDLRTVSVAEMSPHEVSYQAGRVGGFLIGNMILGDQLYLEETALFPLSIQHKVVGQAYLDGVLNGLLRAASINTIHRRNLVHIKQLKSTLMGSVLHCINGLSENKGFLALIRKGPIMLELINSPHKVPPTFPITDRDMGLMVRSWLKKHAFMLDRFDHLTEKYKRVVVFSDMVGGEVIGPYLLSSLVLKALFLTDRKGKHLERLIKVYRELSTSLRLNADLKDIPNTLLGGGVVCCEEVRHACKNMRASTTPSNPAIRDWGPEYVGILEYREIVFRDESDVQSDPTSLPEIPKLQSPLISGLRVAQLATGAHYKLRTIIARLGITYSDFLCGGDGSGGMSACLSRLNSRSRYIYNSLVEYTGTSLRGSSPGIPPAIRDCTKEPGRCVNGESAWMEPSDLSQVETWANFSRLADHHQLDIDLMVFDMEIRSKKTQERIEELIETHGLDILKHRGSIIYKCYGSDLALDLKNNILSRLGRYFNRVLLVNTDLSASFTSELYAVFLKKRIKSDKNKYPSRASLIDAIKICWALGSHKQELQRARSLVPSKLMMGIPPELVQTRYVQLEAMFASMGVESGLCYSLSQRTDQALTIGNSAEVLSCLILAINSIINITSEHLDNWPIPSDGALCNALVIVLGAGYWIAWNNGDCRLYAHLDSFYSKPPTVHLRKWEHEKTQRKMVTWKLIGPSHVQKRLPLSSSLAGIAAWIRVLATDQLPPIKDYYAGRLCAEFNRKLSYKVVQKRTPIFDVWACSARDISSLPENLLEDVHNVETTWQS
ncbi:RNA-dependent RNA polymerase [Fikirini virus]|uniref:Replicase n=1 Tax=Fikirini virus TaxID=1408144 RepID=U5NIE9_9RHAB|nr:RNA-dependent RNA polymerase [Fikirini virus]AGY14297.1 RNA-dependent RNA polymerase [Fikirini virus]